MTYTEIRTLADAERLNDAIQLAICESEKYKAVADGGTSNLDSVTIRIKIPKRYVGVIHCAPRKMLARDYGSLWRGYYSLDIPLDGQGNRRTTMAETAVKRLRNSGYDAVVYYQMD